MVMLRVNATLIYDVIDAGGVGDIDAGRSRFRGTACCAMEIMRDGRISWKVTEMAYRHAEWEFVCCRVCCDSL